VDVSRVGGFIREQRTRARLSLRGLSGVAGVSIPYLSQVERGLRRPSADILQAIAKALRISAETLYVQAGILEHRPAADVATAVMADPALNERQKQALLQIYEAFHRKSVPTPKRRKGVTPQGHGTTDDAAPTTSKSRGRPNASSPRKRGDGPKSAKPRTARTSGSKAT
jgi:transcriptional regulator with XRE-family HTH domain